MEGSERKCEDCGSSRHPHDCSGIIYTDGDKALVSLKRLREFETMSIFISLFYRREFEEFNNEPLFDEVTEAVRLAKENQPDIYDDFILDATEPGDNLNWDEETHRKFVRWLQKAYPNEEVPDENETKVELLKRGNGRTLKENIVVSDRILQKRRLQKNESYISSVISSFHNDEPEGDYESFVEWHRDRHSASPIPSRMDFNTHDDDRLDH